MKATIERMIEYCQVNGTTLRRATIMTYEIEKFVTLIRDVLQFFQYFIRPDFRQKPDLDVATNQYSMIADERTIEELRELVGDKAQFRFEELGSTKVELEDKSGEDEIDYSVSEDDEGEDDVFGEEDYDDEDEDGDVEEVKDPDVIKFIGGITSERSPGDKKRRGFGEENIFETQ